MFGIGIVSGIDCYFMYLKVIVGLHYFGRNIMNVFRFITTVRSNPLHSDKTLVC